MHSLRDCQRALVDAVLRDAGRAVADHLRPTPHLSAVEQLAIYRGSVRVQLRQALADIYPVLRRVIGASCFAGLADDYRRREGSHSPSLHEYGAGLARRVSAYPPLKGMDYLHDLARLEWAWHRSFHAADCDHVLDLAALASVPADAQMRLHFSVRPDLRQLTVQFAVDQVWQAHHPDAGEDPPTLELPPETVHLVVWRPQWTPRIERLDAAPAAVLSAIRNGGSLAELAANHPDLPAQLPELARRGWLTGFSAE